MTYSNTIKKVVNNSYIVVGDDEKLFEMTYEHNGQIVTVNREFGQERKRVIPAGVCVMH